MISIVYTVLGSGDEIVIGSPGMYVPLEVPEADVVSAVMSNMTVEPVHVGEEGGEVFVRERTHGHSVRLQ